MNKSVYPIIIICVLFLALGWAIAQGNGSNIETKHFESNEISFDYPASWQQVTVHGSHLVAFQDPKSGLKMIISRKIAPNGYKPPQNFVPDLINNLNSSTSLKLISQQITDLDGTKAHDNVYRIKVNDSTLEQRELWIETNGAFYSVIFTYPQDSHQTAANTNTLLDFIGQGSSHEKTSQNIEQMDIFTKSLKINATKLIATPIFGTLAIPSLSVEWNMRSDTLNAFNGVYHNSESSYPGLNGTSGFLGHHTLYSAPFAHINELTLGSVIIINDYLTQKKYTYNVVSNGETKWDYHVNPIKYPKGTNELLLITCWPPGFKQAAWIVRCKPVSIEPLVK
ncbi:MAG: sortase domain-containing protein [Methanobacterium sp.]